MFCNRSETPFWAGRAIIMVSKGWGKHPGGPFKIRVPAVRRINEAIARHCPGVLLFSERRRGEMSGERRKGAFLKKAPLTLKIFQRKNTKSEAVRLTGEKRKAYYLSRRRSVTTDFFPFCVSFRLSPHAKTPRPNAMLRPGRNVYFGENSGKGTWRFSAALPSRDGPFPSCRRWGWTRRPPGRWCARPRRVRR